MTFFLNIIYLLRIYNAVNALKYLLKVHDLVTICSS